jgi:signal transduction histidine kinase
MDRPKIYSPTMASAAPPASAQDEAAARAAALKTAGKLKLAALDVRPLVDDVCAQFDERLKAAGIILTVDVPHAPFTADREMLRQAMVHLLANALEAMPGGGELVITSYSGPHGLELEVADSGPGLPEGALAHVFEPFYTTKPHGAGLGLAFVRRIAQAHGGDVAAANCPEGGAAFTLRFPARARQQSAA